MPAATPATNFGALPDGRVVTCHTLANQHGVRVALLDYGATLASVATPDRTGKVAEVTHGYDTLAGWLGNTSYFGATVGRMANRIAAGRFSLDGQTYVLATNNTPGGQPCHLHGGLAGFDKKMWTARPLEKPGARGVEFSLVSPDGDEGYPGTLAATLVYWLTDTNELAMEFRATTDRATVVNLTNHAYWNLTGDPRQAITGHEVQLEADGMLPVTAGLIPTGEQMPVAGTPFDFTRPHQLGARIGADHEQLRFANGYDHCWVLRRGEGVRLAAQVFEPKTGRVLELFTDQPGLQLYSGNFLDGTAVGRKGEAYPFRSAFCLEPQRFPDAPNQPTFPPATLRPGETYRHTSTYRFSTR